jgi:tetratricopeptide (TPR) repeat protein
MPELATKTNQLAEEINQLRLISKIDSFTIARLEREAQKLVKIDAFSAYQLLGILASLKGDIVSLHKNYEKALKLVVTNQDNARALSNYAASLVNMGYFSEAAELSVKSYGYNPPSEVIILIPSRLTYAGLIHKAVDLIRKHNLIEFHFVFEIEQFMDKHGVTDEQLQKLIEIAISVLHEHQFFDFRNSINVEFAEDEYSKWLRYVIKINRSVDEIVEMKYELACALAESDLPTELLLHFIVAYEIAGE